MANLFIPQRIKVGFQSRSGTFTGKLAYVIYYDEKGTLRKEKSWDSWRDKKIPSIELENKPNSGFIFNKGVQRGGYHWGSGRSSIRVYDSRDFEFEINVENLMGILMHSDVSKRDIVEECVFAWNGPELVLLPVNSEEYQLSLEYTKKQSEKFSTKSLVKGYTYNLKKSTDILTYIGYYEWFDWISSTSSRTHRSLGKKHVFYSNEHKSFVSPSVSTISTVNSEEPVSNYAKLVDDFFNTTYAQAIVGTKIIPANKEKNHDQLYRESSDGNLEQYYFSFGKRHPFQYINSRVYPIHTKFVDGNLTIGHALISNGYGDKNHIERSFNTTIKKLGLDVENMTIEDCFKVFAEEKFGILAYVFANGKVQPEHNYY